VAAPLADAGLTKADIRELSRLAGLPTWDRPASACLSSRIPYGTPVTIENVKTVETGEEEIKALGFRQFRVRYHGDVVRIEIARDEMARALTIEMAARFTEIFKSLGFRYVTLDLEGYRQGSLNEVLRKGRRACDFYHTEVQTLSRGLSRSGPSPMSAENPRALPPQRLSLVCWGWCEWGFDRLLSARSRIRSEPRPHTVVP
jgi:hypothetical protein